jgi:hypothetical protein
MKRYVEQLLFDINYATQNASFPPVSNDLWDWKSDEEEDATAPIRNLQEWTGITADMLPPDELLNDEQVSQLFNALNKMLDAYNCCCVICQGDPSERIKYKTIRENFNQDVKVKTWHMGFFQLCKPGTEHYECALGEDCQCAFFAELCSHFIDEDLTPEEERARALECELWHIQRKYGDDWMKYYPYHLDPAYDDEYGNPYDYGFGDDDDEEEDDWWRKPK